MNQNEFESNHFQQIIKKVIFKSEDFAYVQKWINGYLEEHELNNILSYFQMDMKSYKSTSFDLFILCKCNRTFFGDATNKALGYHLF